MSHASVLPASLITEEFVAGIAALERIEPEWPDTILDALERVTLRDGLVGAHAESQRKVLSDRHNAHLIRLPTHRRQPGIAERFERVSFTPAPGAVRVAVERRLS